MSSPSQSLSKVSQPYHHAIQTTLFGGLFGISTIFFANVRPIQGIIFGSSIYLANQLTAPLFVEFLESYQETPLVPLIGQIVHITVSILIAKISCSLVGLSISNQEIKKIGLSSILLLSLSKFALRKLGIN